MNYDVINLENKKVGSVELNDTVFNIDVREDIIARVVDWQLAKRRAGTHLVKTLSTVSGTTRKPFKQKGTGSARSGSLRASQYRHGGVVFGPVLRDHGYSLPKKVRRLGLRSVLSSKQKDGKLFILDEAVMASPKTKMLKDSFEKLGWKSVLVVSGKELNENFALSVRNIIGVDVLPEQGTNVYDIMKKETLVLTKEALEYLEERLK
ncbi:MAG: 50S ribosomal protein L4 [Alphaproteobacteria bacterium]|nr:50S ribosomal protein L4 [Alphaproteobacteria bacterium]NCB49991.1 50S ribosomal protein L4 [Alphaproteobacteria bacterium]